MYTRTVSHTISTESIILNSNAKSATSVAYLKIHHFTLPCIITFTNNPKKFTTASSLVLAYESSPEEKVIEVIINAEEISSEEVITDSSNQLHHTLLHCPAATMKLLSIH